MSYSAFRNHEDSQPTVAITLADLSDRSLRSRLEAMIGPFRSNISIQHFVCFLICKVRCLWPYYSTCSIQAECNRWFQYIL